MCLRDSRKFVWSSVLSVGCSSDWRSSKNIIYDSENRNMHLNLNTWNFSRGFLNLFQWIHGDNDNCPESFLDVLNSTSMSSISLESLVRLILLAGKSRNKEEKTWKDKIRRRIFSFAIWCCRKQNNPVKHLSPLPHTRCHSCSRMWKSLASFLLL